MSKSILVIDTPECCDYCPVGRIFGMAGQVECMAGKDIRVNNNGGIIPDWCPLRYFPQKRDLKDIEKYAGIGTDYVYSEGYNACIDEILKDTK